MKITLYELQKIENAQKRWDEFNYKIVYEFNNNKEQYKGQTLQNGMTITGIGKKCIKIENNFYNWEDIENIASGIEETEDPIIPYILEYIFEDYTIQQEEQYTPRKFTRTEALANFEKVKEEIITHKEHYKTGIINGIGKEAIMVRGYANEPYYCEWTKILNILKEHTIQDYQLLHEDNTSIGYLDPIHIIPILFIDDHEETSEEQRLHEKEDQYAEEKSYIYRHILREDLTVENIRKITRHKYGEKGTEKCEEIINELLQYAFKYTPRVRFTTTEYDVEDANKYAIQDKTSYIYTIENKKIIIDETKHEAKFEDYPQVTFQANQHYIEIYRNNEKVHEQIAGKRDIHINTNKGKKHTTTYTLNKEQQVWILGQLGSIPQVTNKMVREKFLKTCEDIFSTPGNHIAGILREDPLISYTKYDSVRQLAKHIYYDETISTPILQKCLCAVTAEQKGIDKTRIMDYISWDDSRGSDRSVLLEDKYDFHNRTPRRVMNGFAEYEYSQNCEYTRITRTRRDIDTFSVEEIYIKGDISEEEAILYHEYASSMHYMRDVLEKSYLCKHYFDENGEDNI